VTLPDPAEFMPSPLDLAHRHLAHVTGLAVQAEGADLDASEQARRRQLEHVHFAAVYSSLAQAEQLARIAAALEKITEG
jgi:hypothetical protein